MDDYAIFLVSRSSDGEREWFSARDPAAGVVIPAESRDGAYDLVSSLNRAFSHHLRTALSEAEKEVRARALVDAAGTHENRVMSIRHDPTSYKNGKITKSAKRASDFHERSAQVILALQLEER